MVASTLHSGVLVVQDERFGGGRISGYTGRHALVPIFLGLALPAVALGIFAPGLLSNPALVFGLYLMTIFVVSSVIFIRSVFNPGSVVEATFDGVAGTANFVRMGTFATSNVSVPFSKISRIYVDTQFDDDGYKSYLPVIELTDGELVHLPEGTTQGQISSIRAVVGR